MVESHVEWLSMNLELVVPILFFSLITVGAVFMKSRHDDRRHSEWKND